MSEQHAWGDDNRPAIPQIPAQRQPQLPSQMDTAITIAREMLAEYGNATGYDIWAYAQAHGALAESFRILLRAINAEREQGQ
jgi:hypothetical protein